MCNEAYRLLAFYNSNESSVWKNFDKVVKLLGLKDFYQVQVDDNHNCIVLKEGEGQAEMETSTEDAEIEWLTQ